jgi:hypothetical protein
MNERKFKGTAIQMLMAAGLLTDNAIAMTASLTAVRPKWTAGYFTDIKGNITSILEDSFGISANDSLKQLTTDLTTKEASAKSTLQHVKIQIEVDFGKDKTKCNRYLSILGLSNVKNIGNATQSQLSEMLVTFRNNLTLAIETDLTAAGMNPATLTSIKAMALDFYNTNAQQELAKVSTKETNATLTAQLNDVYDEVIGIAKIAASLLTDKADIEKFSYTRALKQVGYVEPPKTTKPPTPKK